MFGFEDNYISRILLVVSVTRVDWLVNRRRLKCKQSSTNALDTLMQAERLHQSMSRKLELPSKITVALGNLVVI